MAVMQPITAGDQTLQSGKERGSLFLKSKLFILFLHLPIRVTCRYLFVYHIFFISVNFSIWVRLGVSFGGLDSVIKSNMER